MANEVRVDFVIGNEAESSQKVHNFSGSLEELNAKMDNLGKNSTFVTDFSRGFDDIGKRVDNVSKSFRSLSQTKLDKGQFDLVSQGALVAEKQVNDLKNRIVSLRKEASDPANAEFGKYYAQGIREAETELVRFERQLERTIALEKEQAVANRASGGAVGLGGAAASANNQLLKGVERGVGLPIGLTALSGIAAFAAVDIVKKIGEDSIKAAEDAEKRTNALKVSVSDLGLNYQKVSASVHNFGEISNQTADDAQKSFVEILKLTRNTKTSADELGAKLADVGANRNIAGDKLAASLENINKGIADTSIYGENGAAIFDQYAASIGKSADQLTVAERKQALMNEALNIGALNAGAASERINSLTGKSEQLSKTWNELLTNIGQNATPSVLAVLGLLNVSFGGSDPKSPEEQNYIDEQNAKKRNAAYIENFNKNKLALADALNNPNRDLVNFSYSHFLDRSKYDGANPEDQNNELKAAITRGTEFAEQRKKSIELALGAPVKNIALLKDYQNNLNFQGSALFPPDVLQKLQKEVGAAISEGTAKGFGLALSDQSTSLNKLRDNLKQISASRDLLPDTKNSLINEYKNKINEEVEHIKTKIEEVQKRAEGIFDNLFVKSNRENPIALAFAEGKKSLDSLKESLRGVPPEVQAVAAMMQTAINKEALFKAGLDNQLSVYNLKRDADNFRHPLDPEKLKLEEDTFTQRFLYKNPNYLYLKQQEYQQAQLVGGLTAQMPFDEFVKKDILNRGKAAFDSPENRLNKELNEQYSIIYGKAKTDKEKADADRSFIALTQGVNPLNLTGDLREEGAGAREREAGRRARYETDNLKIGNEQLAVQKQLVRNSSRLLEIGNTRGEKALDITLKNETEQGAEVVQKPTSQDTANAYHDPNLGFSHNGFSNR